MSYRNNNNRINPKEIINTELTPKANPVDTTIHYQPDKTITGRGNAISDALIKLGQGLVDIEPVWKRQADEAILQNFHDSKGNEREWQDCSKNIKGFAMFNPYLKDAYKRTQAEETVKPAMIEINSNPTLYKMDSVQYANYISQVSENIYKRFQEKGLTQKDYSLAITGFNEFLQNTEKKYYIENSKYQYDMYKKSQTADLSRKLSLLKNDNFIEDFSNIVQSGIDDWGMNIPDDETAEMLWTATVNYVANFGENIDETKLVAALNNIKVNNKPIEDFRPTWQTDVRKLITEVQNMEFQKKYRAYQEKELDMKIKNDKALTDLSNFIFNNPNADFDTQWNYINELKNKYGLEGQESFSLFNTLASSRNTFYQMKEIKTNPETDLYLTKKLCNDTLNPEDIVAALNDKELSINDAIRLYDRLMNKDKKETDELVKDCQKLQKELYNDNSPLTKSLEGLKVPAETANKWKLQISNALDDYRINGDKVVLQQTFENINSEILTTRKKREIGQQLDKTQLNGNVLLNGNYINLQKYNVPVKFSKKQTDPEVIRNQMKRLGGSYNFKITTIPQERRGKTFHGGYDIAAPDGSSIRVPRRSDYKAKAKVVAVGFEKTFGNYIVLGYEDGTFTRIGHMKTNVSKNFPIGTQVRQNQVIGIVGNTGRSSGSHIHIDFWQQGKGLMAVDDFYNVGKIR